MLNHLGVRITASNLLLEKLCPGFASQLYKAPEKAEGQPALDGMEPVLPLRRDNVIDSIALKGELNGWTMVIDFGIDDDTAITLGSCKVDGFRVTPHEGGSVDLAMRIGTSDIDETKAGRLAMLNRHDIVFRLLAPVKKPEAIDGTVAAFEADTQDAGDAFALAHSE